MKIRRYTSPVLGRGSLFLAGRQESLPHDGAHGLVDDLSGGSPNNCHTPTDGGPVVCEERRGKGRGHPVLCAQDVWVHTPAGYRTLNPLLLHLVLLCGRGRGPHVSSTRLFREKKESWKLLYFLASILLYFGLRCVDLPQLVVGIGGFSCEPFVISPRFTCCICCCAVVWSHKTTPELCC